MHHKLFLSMCEAPQYICIYQQYADCGQVNYQSMYKALPPAVIQTGTCSA